VLRTVSFEIGSGNVLAVTPHVDGASLAALVEAYERAKGYDPAGGYGGLIPAYFNYGPLDEYFTGKDKSDYWMSLKGVYLLGCGCGEVGCWPLIASVYQKDDTIRWDGFVQPHRRERDYSGFGPYTFSRAQYEDAVKDLLIRLNSCGANSPT
jgi:hypothetical protein